MASSWLAPSEPAMWGRATLAMEVSSTSMKVARVTTSAMAQGLYLGFHSASGCSASLIVRLLIGYQEADMDSKSSNRKSDVARRMGKLMRQVMVSFKARLDEELKDHHVSTAQLRLLYEVRERPGGAGRRWRGRAW